MSLQLLTPVQVARCIVQGWPYTPDTLAICSWVAAEDGDAGALAVLTAPTRSAPTAGASWAGTSQNGFAAGDLGSRGRRGTLPCTCCYMPGGTYAASVMPSPQNTMTLLISLVAIGLLYMAFPDGCQCKLTLLPRLRPYPVRRHQFLFMTLPPSAECIACDPYKQRRAWEAQIGFWQS